jgi:hypothetical protein
MYKNDNITATNGKFTFPNEGDEYMQAIMLAFVAVETVSVDYARIKMNPEKKVKKYSLDDLSKEMVKLQKKVLDKSNNFVNFVDRTFQFEYTDGKVKRIESNFFTKEIDKYAYAINKIFEYIFILTCKYNVPDEVVKKLSDRAKKINEKCMGNALEIEILELIFQADVEISIKDGHGVIDGQTSGLIIVLYALKELINNIDLDESEATTLEFNTANDELFFEASGNKKILNNIIDKTIIRTRGNLENINNDTFDRELGHILYHMIKNLI